MVTSVKLDSSGTAVGVVTSAGVEVDARMVLSNATPTATMSLLPSGVLDDHTTHAYNNINYESPVTKINGMSLFHVNNLLYTHRMQFTLSLPTTSLMSLHNVVKCHIHYKCVSTSLDELYYLFIKYLIIHFHTVI